MPSENRIPWCTTTCADTFAWRHRTAVRSGGDTTPVLIHQLAVFFARTGWSLVAGIFDSTNVTAIVGPEIPRSQLRTLKRSAFDRFLKTTQQRKLFCYIVLFYKNVRCKKNPHTENCPKLPCPPNNQITFPEKIFINTVVFSMEFERTVLPIYRLDTNRGDNYCSRKKFINKFGNIR